MPPRPPNDPYSRVPPGPGPTEEEARKIYNFRWALGVLQQTHPVAERGRKPQLLTPAPRGKARDEHGNYIPVPDDLQNTLTHLGNHLDPELRSSLDDFKRFICSLAPITRDPILDYLDHLWRTDPAAYNQEMSNLIQSPHISAILDTMNNAQFLDSTAPTTQQQPQTTQPLSPSAKDVAELQNTQLKINNPDYSTSLPGYPTGSGSSAALAAVLLTAIGTGAIKDVTAGVTKTALETLTMISNGYGSRGEWTLLVDILGVIMGIGQKIPALLNIFVLAIAEQLADHALQNGGIDKKTRDDLHDLYLKTWKELGTEQKKREFKAPESDDVIQGRRLDDPYAPDAEDWQQVADDRNPLPGGPSSGPTVGG